MRACLSCQSRKIGRGHARPHQDLKVRSGGFHQPTEQGSARRGTCGLPAGQDGAKVQCFGRFQRRKGVFADIKGTMQGADDRMASGLCSGPGGRVDGTQCVRIQFPLRGQHTGHNAVRTRLHQRCGGLGHLGKLIAVVAEIAEPGPQQGTHRQAGLGLDLPHQRKAGRGAADDQVGAQLQPVGPAPLCRKGACDTVYTNFQCVSHKYLQGPSASLLTGLSLP